MQLEEITKKFKLLYKINKSFYRDIKDKFIPLENNKNLISIITLNNCNLNCFFCRGGVDSSKLREYSRFKIMNTIEFKEIVERCLESDIKFFDLTPAIGEPFIDKDFINKLLVLEGDSRVIEYTVTTNLLLLTMEHILKLSRLKKLILDVSIYGETPEEYLKNTNRNEFTNFIDKLKLLYNNCGDLKMRFIQRCNLNDECDMIHYINAFRLKKNVNLVTNETFNVNRAGCVSQSSTRSRSGICPFGPGAGGGIVTGGDLLFCPFHDFERKGVIGNIFKNSLKEIYKNEKWQDLLTNHTNNNYIGMCEGCDETW
jgi:MoaA/NifB/PqqE/SkfB family radical SAM enzyme